MQGTKVSLLKDGHLAPAVQLGLFVWILLWGEDYSSLQMQNCTWKWEIWETGLS